MTAKDAPDLEPARTREFTRVVSTESADVTDDRDEPLLVEHRDVSNDNLTVTRKLSKFSAANTSRITTRSLSAAVGGD